MIEIGEFIRDNTEFDEWWYERNAELDEAFGDWINELFDESSYGYPEYDDFCFA